MEVNEEQKTSIIPKIKSFYNEDLSGKTFALWGLAFKPDTDDIREAPALYIINELLNAGAKVKAFDPEAMDNVAEHFGDKIEFCSNEYDSLVNSDALIIATEWSVFRTPDFNKVSSLLKENVIFDGRNLYDLDQMRKLNFFYSSVGRETIEKI